MNTSRWRFVRSAAILGAGLAAASVAVGLGGTTAVASIGTGTLYSAGLDSVGQLGVGGSAVTTTCSASGDPCSTAPVIPALPTGISPESFATGGSITGSDTAYVNGSDGKLYAWGSNTSGQLGTGSLGGPELCSGLACSSTPVAVALPTAALPVVQVATSGGTTFALGADGNVYGWGGDNAGQLGNGVNSPPSGCSGVSCPTPTQIPLPGGVSAVGVAAGSRTGFALASNGTVYSWGFGEFGELGNGASLQPGQPSQEIPFSPGAVSLPAGVTATQIWAGDYSVFADGSDGQVYSWGFNGYGQLGHGESSSLDSSVEPDYAISTPWTVALPSGVQLDSLQSTGFYTSFGVGSDGHVYVWGNNVGDFGNGSTQSTSTVPETVGLPNAEPAVSVAAALSAGSSVPSVDVEGADGHLYQWGLSSNGEFADGQQSETFASPVLNPWLSNVSALAAAPSLLLVRGQFTPPFVASPKGAKAAGEDLSTKYSVATVTPTGSGLTAASFAATIDWGDGTIPTPGTSTPTAAGFTISGSHTYAATGAFTVTTSITASGYTTKTAATVTVSGPPTPALSAVSPASLGQGKTAFLTLTGKYFTANQTTSLSYSSPSLSTVSTVYKSSTKLAIKVKVATTAPIGTVSITVTTPGGSATCTNCLTITPKV